MSGELHCKCGRMLALTCFTCDEAEEDAIWAMEQERDNRIRKDVDTEIRAAIGSCWNHMWGPPLEQLGHIIDMDRRRAVAAEAEVERLRAALVRANEMVCRHSMPYGWIEFQDEHKLPHADQVLRPTAARPKEPT